MAGVTARQITLAASCKMAADPLLSFSSYNNVSLLPPIRYYEQLTYHRFNAIPVYNETITLSIELTDQ